MQPVLSSAHTFRRLLATILVGGAVVAGSTAFAVGPSLAAINPSQTEPDALTKARSLIKSGQLRAALIELKNIARADPKNIDVRVELANLYLQANDGLSAEKEWRAAIQAGYPFDKALDGLSLSILMQGEAQRLLKEFDAAKYTGELNARVHLFRAQAHLALTEVALAQQEVAAAQTAAPNYFGVYLASSRLHQRGGDLKAADADIDQALKLAPTDVETLLQKGELRGALGDVPGAISYFDRVIAANKNDLRARLGRAAAMISDHKSEAAEQEIDDILKVAPGSPVATYFKALLLAQRGKKEDALALLSKINGIEKLPPALYLLSALHLAKGETEQAKKYIDAYLARQPNDLRGQLLLIALRLAHGEVVATLPKLEELKSKLPNDYTTALLLGNAYLSLGRYADAAAQFQTASTASPQAQEASVGLAQSLLGEGKADESAKILQGLATDTQGSSRESALLIISLIKSKDFPGAYKAAADFMKREPKSPSGPYLKAAIDAAKSDVEATRKDLQQALALDATFSAADLALAQIARAEKKPEDARSHYQAVLAHVPTSVEAHVGLATLALDVGDKAGALDWLKKAEVANPTAPAPRLLAINLLLTQRKAAEALKEANEFVLQSPTSPTAVDALGVCQLINHDAKSAVATFTKLVTLAPNTVFAHLRLASAYRAAQDNQSARRSVDAALKVDPSSLDANRALIDLTLASESPDAAVKAADMARSAISDKSVGNLLYADTLRSAGRLSDAEAIYKDAWKKKPNPALLSTYTQTLEAQGKYAPARATIKDWLKDHPTDSNARFLLVVNSISAQQYAEALSDGEVLRKERPKDVALLNNVAWLYDRTGKPDKAIELAQQAYAEAPASPEVGDTLGWLLVRNKQLDHGRDLLKAAHELSPRSPDIAYHYAVALNQSGKAAEARTVLSESLKGTQQFAERKDAEKLLASLH